MRMAGIVHKETTDALLEFARREYVRSNDQGGLVSMDGCLDRHSPSAIRRHRPGLYIRNNRASVAIIGEAKTENDFMTPRSKNQISGFIDYLAELEGQSILILCIALNQFGNAQRFIESSKPAKRRKNNCVDELYRKSKLPSRAPHFNGKPQATRQD